MLRGLARGVPGGWIAIAAGVAVAAAGVRRLWTAHWTLPTLLILPGLLTAVAMVALGHNLWPRFFFFSAGFAAIIAVRGTFALAERVRTRWAMPAATTLLLLLAAGSLWTVPRAWGPKQDFESAWAHVAAHRAPGDAVVTVDLTTFPYERYVPCECIPVQSAGELASIEATHPRTWLMYTFPIRLRAVQPAIWKQLEAAYDTSAVFPGTVSGGAVVVMVTRAPSPAS
jgi:hypothetical protein